MDNADKIAEYEALQRRAEELRRELGMGLPLDKQLGVLARRSTGFGN